MEALQETTWLVTDHAHTCAYLICLSVLKAKEVTYLCVRVLCFPIQSQASCFFVYLWNSRMNCLDIRDICADECEKGDSEKSCFLITASSNNLTSCWPLCLIQTSLIWMWVRAFGAVWSSLFYNKVTDDVLENAKSFHYTLVSVLCHHASHCRN